MLKKGQNVDLHVGQKCGIRIFVGLVQKEKLDFPYKCTRSLCK